MSGAMRTLGHMSGAGAASKRATAMPIDDRDEVVVAIHVPKRLAYRPSIPASEVRKIVYKVVRARQAREREFAVNGNTP